MHRVAFIINPKSSGKSLLPFLKKLKKKVKTPNFYISDSTEGTREYIRNNFDLADIFVAVGGDGTISTVAAELVYTEKILAIFPAGSGNGFARETHFTKNFDTLLAKISAGKTTKIDTVTINGLLAVNMAGAGYDAAVTREFEKTSRGFKNYIKVSLSVFFKYRPFSLYFDDAELSRYNGEYMMMNIANSRQFGNNARIAPNALLADGLADLVLVKKFPVGYAPRFAYRMFSGTLREDRYLSFLKISAATLRLATQDWHLDGEFRRIPSPIEVCVQPQSLHILI